MGLLRRGSRQPLNYTLDAMLQFQISDNARFSFLREKPFGCKKPVLIQASTHKIRQYWAETDQGRDFFSCIGGVEKPLKLERACLWIAANQTIWAPVIDFRSYDPEKIQFSDGRHTFVALEQLNFSCIEVAVPDEQASTLISLLQCVRP